MNNTSNSAVSVGVLAGLGLFFLIALAALIVVIIAGHWKIFTKAGKPGWAAIIPIYNLIVLLEIAGKPIWWILLFLIPGVNLVISILVIAGLARNFDRGLGTILGLIFLPIIFYPILGFGDARYVGTPSQ